MAAAHRHTTRRHFLRTAGVTLGGAALLAACGGDSTDSQGSTSGGDDDAAAPEGFGVVQRYPNMNLFVPGEVRLPVSITDGQNILSAGPAVLTGWVETFDGERVAEVSAPRRSEGIEIPYWEVRVQLDRAIIHTLRFEGDDGYGATFEVWDPADAAEPRLGEPFPPFDTPTVDDHRGVEPYCSLTPEPCPFHTVTLTQALAAGLPTVYVVGTPAHCSTGTCAPGLQLLVDEIGRRPGAATVVHADVFADDAATEIAPAVLALGIEYEPVAYLIDAEGVLVDRLDAVWDAGELAARLDLLLA